MVTQFQKMGADFISKLQGYGENPRQLILDLRALRLKAMRQALVGKVAGVKVENLIVDDEIELENRPVGRKGQVQRLFSSRLALHAASRIETRQRGRMLMLSLGALIFCISAITYFTTTPTSLPSKYAMQALSLMMFAWAGWASWRFLGISPSAYTGLIDKEALTHADLDDAKAFAERVLVRATPADAPADLQDIYRPLTIDAEGNAVDTQIVPQDFDGDYLTRVLSEGREVYLLIAAGFFLSGILGAEGSLAGLGLIMSILLVATVIAGIRAFRLPSITEQRAVQSENAHRVSPNARLVEQVGPDHFVSLERARKLQVEAAKKDDTPFIRLGTTTGQFAERRDPYAPSESGMPFGLTVNDLSTHLLVIGRTGSGKTSGALRPLIGQWHSVKAGGLLVLDGKGVLPAEVADLPGFYVITPGGAPYAPIENLEPDEVADCLLEMFGSKEASDPFWQQAACEYIRSAAKTLYLLAGYEYEMDRRRRVRFEEAKEAGEAEGEFRPAVRRWKWTLASLYEIALVPSVLPDVRKVIEGETEEEKAVFAQLKGDYLRAYIDFSQTFPSLPEATRNSILQNANVWLGTLVNSSALSAWADCEEGVEIEDALYGRKIGLLLPEFRYGHAGVVISNFAKRRFYSAVKRRGKSWKTGEGTRAMLVIDECQALITKDEQDILPVVREFGLSCVFATQNIEGIEAALKSPEATRQLLDQFVALVALKVKSPASCKFVADTIGAVSRTIQTEAPAPVSDASATANLMQAQSGSYKPGTLMAAATSSPDVRKFRKNGLLPEFAVKATTQLLQPVVRELVQPEKDQKNGNVKIGCHEIITPAEVPSLTAEPFTAIAIVNRGGVERRDKIVLTPVFSFAQEAK